MNVLKRYAIPVILLFVVSSFTAAQDLFRSTASGNWGSAATWEKSTDGGTTWAAATSAPGQADSASNFIIASGTTVIVEGSPRYCNNLTVEANALIYANVQQPTSSIRYLRMKGSSLQVDGTFGFPGDGTDSSDVLSIEPRGDSTLTITGSGAINISRLRPQSGRSNVTVVFDANVTMTYAGGSGTGGSAIYSSNSGSDNFTVTINPGRNVTGVPNANIATASSTGSDGSANTTFNINGTLNMTAGILSLRTADGSNTTLNVTGTLMIGKDLLPTGTTGVTSTINVTGSGVLQVSTTPGRMADFTNPDQFVSGSGSFILGSGSKIKVGAPDGLNAATGPVRTTTVTMSSTGIYEYVGTAAQVTGDQLPSSIAELTVNNPAGVTLTQNVTVDTTLRFTSGNLVTGSDTVTVGSLGTISRTSGHVVGTLRKLGVAAAQTLAVGTSSDYAPIDITPTAGSGDIIIAAVAGNHATPPSQLQPIGLYWMLDVSGITSADLVFSYPQTLVPGDESGLVAMRYTGTGSVWESQTTTVDAGNNTATVTGITSFSDWTLARTAYDDPASVAVKNSAGVTLDGQLNEADWTGAPALLYGLGAFTKKQAGEMTVTAAVDVKNPFTDATVEYSVPHTDSSLARVRVLRKGLKLYIGVESDDKSICKFDWEGDGLFVKIKNRSDEDREYKLYWQSIDATKNTMKYEEQEAGSGSGAGYLETGSTVNDTSDVDSGYSAEMMIDLQKLGYSDPLPTIQVTIVVFDPDGFQHPMAPWDHTIGSFYKSWWGSEWGGRIAA